MRKTLEDMLRHVLKLYQNVIHICNAIHYSICWFILDGLQCMSIFCFPKPATDTVLVAAVVVLVFTTEYKCGAQYCFSTCL